MGGEQRAEETAVCCANCGAVYPALRLPDGSLIRRGELKSCPCGRGSVIEIADAD